MAEQSDPGRWQHGFRERQCAERVRARGLVRWSSRNTGIPAVLRQEHGRTGAIRGLTGPRYEPRSKVCVAMKRDEHHVRRATWALPSRWPDPEAKQPVS